MMRVGGAVCQSSICFCFTDLKYTSDVTYSVTSLAGECHLVNILELALFA